ncbi:unnamed protein product [Periconia digitata]|uniref:Uncharacterized protein n=1 Tax=Periconia digitata TaxID=1303443 RepID=A0A9W4UJK3_9PLEO|nr:unnamed protein product [Periconia digitata]
MEQQVVCEHHGRYDGILDTSDQSEFHHGVRVRDIGDEDARGVYEIDPSSYPFVPSLAAFVHGFHIIFAGNDLDTATDLARDTRLRPRPCNLALSNAIRP